MKRLYSDQENTTIGIGKYLGITKEYLNDYINGKIRLEDIPDEVILGIAKLEKIEPNELYSKLLVLEIKRGEENERIKHI